MTIIMQTPFENLFFGELKTQMTLCCLPTTRPNDTWCIIIVNKKNLLLKVDQR